MFKVQLVDYSGSLMMIIGYWRWKGHGSHFGRKKKKKHLWCRGYQHTAITCFLPSYNFMDSK